MGLARTARPRATISLVPLVDVMLILLIFFMVTSTYLNLDMVPVVDKGAASDTTETTAPTPAGATGSVMLLRLGADGRAYFRGAPFSAPEVIATITTRLQEDPATSVVVLPSGGATMQALVTLMEQAGRAGISNLRIMRLDARP